MLKLLICGLVALLMPICFVKSGEIAMYTREELIEFFVDHGCLIKDESIIVPLLVQNASNIGIEEVTNHFLEYQTVDLLFDFKTQSDSKQAVVLYELKNDYVALIVFDMSTRYITSTLLLEPACNAYNFSRIILNETTLNEIIELDPNAYNDPFISSEISTYHYICKDGYYKIIYGDNPDGGPVVATSIISIDFESCPSIVKIIGTALSR